MATKTEYKPVPKENAGYKITEITYGRGVNEYLAVVVGVSQEQECGYVVWGYNRQDGGFFSGNYVRTVGQAAAAWRRLASVYLNYNEEGGDDEGRN